MEIIFATANKHKLLEAQAIIGDNFSLITPLSLGITEDIPETGQTLEANALLKAEYLWKRFKKPCFADDTGLEIDSLGGKPGVYSARYAGLSNNPIENMLKVLKELNHNKERSARFRTVVVLILEGNPYYFEGKLEGTILESPIGEKGFGYDPIFVPVGLGLSLAQISSEYKNSISHRGQAMRKLSIFLSQKLHT